MRTLEPLAAGGVAFRNFGKGTVRNVDMWGRWHPSDSLHFSAGLKQQKVRTGLSAGSRDSSGTTGRSTNDPDRRWLLRASKDIRDAMQVHVTLHYSGSLPRPAVPVADRPESAAKIARRIRQRPGVAARSRAASC